MGKHWTPEETDIVAKKFIEFRLGNPIVNAVDLLRKAQEALPKERRRATVNITAYKIVVERINELWMSPGPCEHLFVAPAAVPVAPAASVAPTQNGHLIIEFRSPPAPDLSAVLTQAPTAVLLGHALERLLSRIPTPPLPVRPVDAVQVHVAPSAAPVSAPVPGAKPTILLPESVSGSNSIKKVVAVIGMQAPIVILLRQKLVKWPSLEVTFIDPAKVGGLSCDCAILAQRMVTHFQAEQLHRRFAKRLVLVDGTREEVEEQLTHLEHECAPAGG